MKKFVINNEKGLRLLGSIINTFIYAIAFASIVHSIYCASSTFAVILLSVFLFLILMVILFSMKEIISSFNINWRKALPTIQKYSTSTSIFLYLVYFFCAATDIFIGSIDYLIDVTIVFMLYLVISNIVFWFLQLKNK